jgi:serine/threonine-protein kinase
VVECPTVPIGTRIKSPESGTVYTLRELLGQGGMGAAYRAQQAGEDVCVKLTYDDASWHREAYMAELLRGHPRVVSVYETFPVFRRDGVCYAVAMELATGTVEDAIAEASWSEQKWSEHKVRTEIRGLLSALSKLHNSGGVHRDITPFNVFVCGPKRILKLGDFGIARHGPKTKGVKVDYFNPSFVDTDVYAGSKDRWSPSDDLWQVAQIAAVLLRGDVHPIRTSDVKALPCGDAMKLAIRRAIGEPVARFLDAQAMSSALGPSTTLQFADIRSLRGKALVFTGPLGGGLRRREAAALAKKRGAIVLPDPSGSMDVLVVGNPSPSFIAGTAGGVKVLETLALRERGHRISFLKGAKFRQLVGRR